MSFLEKLHEVKTFIFDVDGVLTDAFVLVQEDGTLLRMMNTKDGFAIRHALTQGYKIFVITGGKSPGLLARLKNLGIAEENIFMDVQEKLDAMRELVRSGRVDLSNSTYMGDDIPDYAPMRLVLFAACPRDATHEIKEISQYVSPFDGGRGCVRDIIEKVLRVQGKWFKLDVVNL